MDKLAEEEARTCWRVRMNLYNYVTSAEYAVVLYWRSKIKTLNNE
jgi:hypothetical protein